MIEAIIEKMVYGGKGIARHNGLTLFVSGVLPGEKAQVEIRNKKRGIVEAELINVITASPDRIKPPCNGEEECTGAPWTHISYPAQLKLKQAILLETFKKIGKIVPKEVLPIIPSPDTAHYRLRVQFNVRYQDARPMIGFFREGTHHLIEIKNGFLLHPLINKTLNAIRGIANQLPPLKEIHVNASPEGEVLILFFINSEAPPSLENIFDALKKEVNEIAGVISYAGRKKWEILGKNYIRLRFNDIIYQSTEGNFFQVNWRQNKNMIESILNLAELKGSENVLDLYCGLGNFSLPIAKMAERVVGIESGYSAIEDAKKNAEANRIQNVEFICDDVRKGLKMLLARKERADIIVLDPPRAGATKKIVERIIALSPAKVLYVSCNPTTMARDIEMIQKGGYMLNRLQPIDMFPHTYHIESIAELVRGAVSY